MGPLDVTRQPRANRPNHASTQDMSVKEPSEDPMSARKRVANPRSIAKIMPAPETLQEFPRQEAAEDAAQRDNQRCTHHDSRDQNINPSRPSEPTRKKAATAQEGKRNQAQKGSPNVAVPSGKRSSASIRNISRSSTTWNMPTAQEPSESMISS